VPTAREQNRIRIAVASSRDFIHWEKHGLVPGDLNTVDNKNAMLFPGRIGGKFVLLHRPMSGPDAMCIHWAEAEGPLGIWRNRGVLMRPLPNPAFKETWIGGGAPPVPLPDGRFLIIYHIGNRKFDSTREYDLGICIADPKHPDFIVERREPFMTPTTPAETTGDADLGVNNVVFICSAYSYNRDLYFPYAGADSVVLQAA
jgi:beta-1,2-mannobiose phosphorylase / 1,2-beta-oligomannan phosphorylase